MIIRNRRRENRTNVPNDLKCMRAHVCIHALLDASFIVIFNTCRIHIE